MFLLTFVLIFAMGQAEICPAGSTYSNFRGGSCIIAVSNAATWSNAQSFCQLVNGNLPVARNAFENAQLSGAIQTFNSAATWLGAYSDISANWMDLNSTKLTYDRFVPGQSSKVSACALMQTEGNWYASGCSTLSGYLCVINQSPQTTTTVSPTTYTTITSRSYVTNATVSPTLNPKLCPGYATDSITTPCPKGYSFYLPTCSCYSLFSPVSRTWFEAEQHCVSNNGHLVSIHSQDEAVFIMGLNTDSTKMIQIGLQYIANQWIWSDGTSTDFINWALRGGYSDYNKYSCGLIMGEGYYFASYVINDECKARYTHSVCKRSLLK